jgi:hypothetical protein
VRTPGGNRANAEEIKANTEIVADLDVDRNAFLTLRARYALAGLQLLELSDGTLLATKWNLCRPLPDATAAHRFLLQIGGAS